MSPVSTVIGTEHIGPGTPGSRGTQEASLVDRKDFKAVEGPKPVPKPMSPPEIKFAKNNREALENYLEYEVYQCDFERSEWMTKLARLKNKYRAPFPTMSKDWPIHNASQITIPIIKTTVLTSSARINQTIQAAEPLASVRVEDSEWQDIAFDYERFLDLYSTEKLEMDEILDTGITEFTMLGTTVLEVSTLTDRRNIVDWDAVSNEYSQSTKDVYNGPIVYAVPLADFWIRPAFPDLQKAPWCGKVVRKSWSEIKDMALSGELDPKQIDRIWNWEIGSSTSDVPETVEQDEKDAPMKPNDRDQFRIFELSVRWDPQGIGVESEIMVRFHLESRTVLRSWFSGFQKRPWVAARYSTLPHWFYGEGLAEQLEHLQEEISTTHNQRIDNATLANLKIILVRKLIKGLRPGDRIWSGKIIKVPNSVKDDVGTLQLSEIYPSTVTNEQIALQYVERLSGVGETATGGAQPVSRTTATAQLALLEELNRRFDKAVKSYRKGLTAVYLQINDLFMQRGTGGLAETWLGIAAGGRLEQFLQMPRELVKRKMKVKIVATRSTVNREVEFQTQIAVFQLIIQLWTQVRAEAGQLAPQLVPVLAHEMVKSIIPVFKKVMQYADAPDPDAAISVLSVLERILPAPEDMGGMGQAQGDETTQQLIDSLTGGAGGESGNGQAPEGNDRFAAMAAALGGAGNPNGAV